MSIQLLRSLSEILSDVPSPANTEKALDELRRFFKTEQCEIFAFSDEGRNIVTLAGNDAERKNRVLPLKRQASELFRDKKPRFFGSHDLFIPETASGLPFAKALMIPICRSGENIGILGIQPERDCSRDDLALLSVAASLLAPAVDRLRFTSATVISHNGRPLGFVGNSAKMCGVYTQISHVASSGTTVLITGESGTGKELAAHAIHEASRRANGPFVSLNCAALPENLVESELFGHEKGAFTGAISARSGRFEQADGGTLFLDEVGELSPFVQAKLLRVLQEHAFERLGAMRSTRVDVRIVTATNRNLEAMVEEGTFRRDLFYRLNVFTIRMPSLRERAEDILPLALHFVKKFAKANGMKELRLSLTVQDMLQRYSWPGNVRELSNVMERAVLLAEGYEMILPQHLPGSLHSETCPFGKNETVFSPFSSLGPLQSRLEEMERVCITDALTHFRGHIGRAAEALCLSERVMALRMKKYGINYKTFRSSEE